MEMTDESGESATWDERDFKLLIAERVAKDPEFRGKRKHTHAWCAILEVFKEKYPGRSLTHQKLKEKWEYLCRGYKTRRAEREKSGAAGPCNWKYYNDLDAFHGNSADVTFTQDLVSVGGPSPINLPSLQSSPTSAEKPEGRSRKRSKIDSLLEQQLEVAKRLEEDRKAYLKLKERQNAEKTFYLRALVEHTVGKPLEFVPAVEVEEDEENHASYDYSTLDILNLPES